MTGNHGMDDERLRALFHDAVSDVEPHDGLGEVRRRTRVRRTSSRRWAPVLVGAGAVAATVVAATFVVNGLGDDPDRRRPAGRQHVAERVDERSDDRGRRPLLRVRHRDRSPAVPGVPGRHPDRRSRAEGAASHSSGSRPVRGIRTTARSGRRTRSAPSGSRTTGSSSSSAPRTRPRGRARRRRARRAAGGLHRRSRARRHAAGELRVGRPAGPAGARPEGRHRWSSATRSFGITAPVNITDPSEQLAVDGGTLRRQRHHGDQRAEVEWSLSLQTATSCCEGARRRSTSPGPTRGRRSHAPGWETEEIDVSGLAPGDYVFDRHGPRRRPDLRPAP